MIKTIILASLLALSLASPGLAEDLSIASSTINTSGLTGIESVAWEGKNLVLTILWESGCQDDHSWDSELNEERLTLIQTIVPPKTPTAACRSFHRDVITIKKLKKTDYSITYKIGLTVADTIFLRKDNFFSDSCDSHPTYECYASRDMGGSSKTPRQDHKILLANKEDEAILQKYPDFTALFKELEEHNWEDNYVLGFDPAQGIWAAAGNWDIPPTNAQALGHHLPLSGASVCKSFECAVKYYIDNHKSSTALESQLSSRLGFVVEYADPDVDAFVVIYNNERIHYDENGLIFKDRPNWWSITEFYFKPHLPPSKELTAEQFEHYAALADTAYQILIGLKCEQVIGPTIYPETNILEGFGTFPSDQKAEYLIHNRKVMIDKKISQKFQIDLTSKQFYRLESTPGEFTKLKFTGDGLVTCPGGKVIKGHFENGQSPGNDHC